MQDTRHESEKSLGDLFANLSRQLTTLLRQEVALAKTEMTRKASSMGKDIGLLAAGGVLAFVGLLAFVAALILALALILPGWLAAAIIAVIILGIGGLLALLGLHALKQVDPAPHQTLETLQEDATWAKEQMH